MVDLPHDSGRDGLFAYHDVRGAAELCLLLSRLSKDAELDEKGV